ncbi:phage terminase large subunit [Pedobacter gandavensis]|uniref:phage terminase large subunit n=1 Tax=Pedobacter gandavensis TaxID=2679963 RepID=UPI0029317CE0|nr:phage terminase large subunit [Pedobacter gandavensis]
MNVQLNLQLLHPAQQVIYDSKASRVIAMCGRQFGKSSLCINKCIDYLIGLNNELKGENVMYITPFYKLAKKFYRDIFKILNDAGLVKSKNETDLMITLINDCYISFYSADNDSAIRGNNTYTLVIIDEAGYLDFETLYADVVEPMIGAKPRGQIYIISTPNSTNGFYKYWLDAKNGMEDWEAFKFPTSANPYYPAETLAKIKKNAKNLKKYEQEYECNVLSSASCPWDNATITRNVITTLSNNPTVCYGIDISKGGSEHSDKTVVYGIDKIGNCTYLDSWRIDDYSIQTDKIASLPKGILKVIDSTAFSAGSVIYEQLRNKGHYIEGFEFGGGNKAKLIYNYIEAVERDKVKYPQSTADEMQIYEIRYTKSGNAQFGNQIGVNLHDDEVTAGALAYEGLSKYVGYGVNKWKGLY